MASVKVAVRVRPFNSREIEMSSKRIIEMINKKTRIYRKKNEITTEDNYKDFTFDYSYWSFNEHDDHFATQEKVFKDLGTDVVESAFQGYNACVFAYGQTGSGKTFTMMGSSENLGLIPRICESLFSRMTSGSSYRIEVSYLEIYNEKVKDLLKTGSAHNLKIREHPTLGPIIQELSKHLVTEYSHIQKLMEKGSSERKTASTKMNDFSSRSHAIFTIMFVQAGMCDDLPTETVSKIHLVDLAGSERADATGATGQRLKEGAHINKSLVTLGSVISALAESCGVKERTQRNVFIPYRDSVLTWLLKDSLGGNSKTIMIAAISPADCNYSETLSTLRYANRAKNIINKPTVNEDPNVKLIRELRAEIMKLKGLIRSEYADCKSKVLATLHKKEEEEKSLTEKWAKKWQETQVILQEQEALALRKAGTGVVLDSDRPHLICIDDNLLSTGVTLYHLVDGETLIGTTDASEKQHIILSGHDMKNEHCSILLKNGEATLIPQKNATCWVNGQPVDSPTTLFQGCIIMVGHTNMFRYNDPVQAEKMRKEGDISRSHLNLSKISMMSWSNTDLAQSSDLTKLMDSEESECGIDNLKLKEKYQVKESTEATAKQNGRETDDTQCERLFQRVSCNEEREVDLLHYPDSNFNVEATSDFILGMEVLSDMVNKNIDLEVGVDVNRDVTHNTWLQKGERNSWDPTLSESVSAQECSQCLTRSVLSPFEVSGTEEVLFNALAIHIPSFVLRGTGSSTHYEYEVVINAGNHKWSVLRRYSRFRQLHLQMKEEYGLLIAALQFPRRKPFCRQSERLAKERRVQLEYYLQNLLKVCSEIPGCPLNLLDTPPKESLVMFSTFFRRGIFELGKYATS